MGADLREEYTESLISHCSFLRLYLKKNMSTYIIMGKEGG